MTDNDALTEIRNGLSKQENFRHFDAESDALAHIATRLEELRAREDEEADPHCGYCNVRRSAHGEADSDPKSCLVFTAGEL